MNPIPFNSPEYPKELHECIHNFAYQNSYEIVPYKNRSLIFTNHFFYERLNAIATKHLINSVNITPVSLGTTRWVRAGMEKIYTLDRLTRFFGIQTSFRISHCKLTNSINENLILKFKNVICLEMDSSTINYGLLYRINSWGSKIKILSLSNVKIYKASNKKFKSSKHQIKTLKKDPEYKNYQAIEYLFYTIRNIPLEHLYIDKMILSHQSIINICNITSLKELDLLGEYSVKYDPETLIEHIHNLSSLKILRVDLSRYTFEQVYKLLTTLNKFLTLDILEISNFSEDHVHGQDTFQLNEVYRCLFYTSKKLHLNSSVIQNLDLDEFDIQNLKCKIIALSHTYLDPSIYNLILQKGPLDIVECSQYNYIELIQYPEWAQDNSDRIDFLSALKLNRLYFILNEQIKNLASLNIQAKSLYLDRCKQLDATSILNFITKNETVENLYLINIFPFISPKYIQQPSFIDLVYWLIQSVYVSSNTTIKTITFTYDRDAPIPDVLSELRAKVPKSSCQFKRIKKGFEIHFPIRNIGQKLLVNWISLDSIEIDLAENYYSALYTNLNYLKGIDKICYRNFQEEINSSFLNCPIENDFSTGVFMEDFVTEATEILKMILSTSHSVQLQNSSLSRKHIKISQVLTEPTVPISSKPSILYADYSSLSIVDIEYLFFSIKRFSHFIDISATENDMTQDQIQSVQNWYSQIAQLKFESLSILNPSVFLNHNLWPLKAKNVSFHNLKEDNFESIRFFLNQNHEIENLIFYFDSFILADSVSTFLSEIDDNYDKNFLPKKFFVFKVLSPNTFIESLFYSYQYFEVDHYIISSNEIILHIIDKFGEPIDQFEDTENRVINDLPQVTMDELISKFKNISLE